jgi:PTH2 family peptidyl-tRNA hydrolase
MSHIDFSTHAEFVTALVSMGFDEAASQRAVTATDNMEDAIQWILTDQDSDLGALELDTGAELKMVCVVRSDIGMSPGKVAAQVAHAALGAYRKSLQTNPQLTGRWEGTGEKVVCVQCKSLLELERIYSSAFTAGLPAHVVCDAGRTEIAPGSLTVAAIGPAPMALIDSITGSLRLY